MLTPEKKIKLQPLNFPAAYQAVIFRNYGSVDTRRLASVLGTDEKTVVAEAERLGLHETSFDPRWQTMGYITVIRNNWYLLPYHQLLELTGLSSEQLEYILKEEDFLEHKLGFYKPECEPVRYAPLTEEQINETKKIKERIRCLPELGRKAYFELYPDIDASDNGQECEFHGITQGSVRFIHGYITPCGDVFSVKSESYLSDGVLKKYRDSGINGIWIHAVLSALSPYPFDERLCRGYEQRRKNLRELIERCEKYGIGVYLYFNEPRYLPTDIAERYPDITGEERPYGKAFCFSTEGPKKYLYNAFSSLLRECAPRGIMTITMSENLTHCLSKFSTECKRCKGKRAEYFAATVNNIIQRAIRDTGAKTELIANLWGWDRGGDEELKYGIDLLDNEISVLMVSENAVVTNKGGVLGKVIDYSISNPGPSELSKAGLDHAVKSGRRTYAKIQANNSWECSAVPYLPVFPLVKEHLDALYDIGTENYMLSWTLGGYPSPVLRMIAAYRRDMDLSTWYRSEYGKDADIVEEACRLISEGFREYPFAVEHLYFSPQTIGQANMWYLEPDEKSSTMVCFAFDDYENWTSIYPYEVFIGQTELMLNKWKRGYEMLLGAWEPTERTRELALFAEVSYLHLECDLLHTKYARLKRSPRENREELLYLADLAMRSTERLIALSPLDARIGFEASNHYFYNDNILLEKLINLQKFKEDLLNLR